jgi:hypothetical protein
MDGERILNEELTGLGYELINLKWYEKTIEEAADELTKGLKIVSDIPVKGAEIHAHAWIQLHYPLMESEIERYKIAASQAEEILSRVASKIEPGMSEKNVESLLRIEYAKEDFLDTVILIGADVRLGKYRHPTPTDNQIKSTVLLAPSPRKFGLYMPISRMVCFNAQAYGELKSKYDALLSFEANVMARCVTGESFLSMMEYEKSMYRSSSYPDEWKYHFMGGLTGYIPNDPYGYLDPLAKIASGQTFNWYLTISGAKVEEILLTGESGNEIISVSGSWPVKKVEAGEKCYMLPDILRRF